MIAAVDLPAATSLQAAVHGTTRPAALALGMTTRVLEGFAAFWPVAILLVEPTWLPGGVWQLTVVNSALLGGIGLGLILQNRILSGFSRIAAGRDQNVSTPGQADAGGQAGQPMVSGIRRYRLAWISATLFLSLGLLLLAADKSLPTAIVSRLICGLGIVGQWSALAAVMRASLANADRWRGVCALNFGFLTGVVGSAGLVWLIHDSGFLAAVQTAAVWNLITVTAAVVACLLAAAVALSGDWLPAAIPIAAAAPDLPPTAAAGCETACSGEMPTGSAPESCEAVSCCSARVWRPMPAGVAAAIGAVGQLTLFSVLVQILWLSHSSAAGLPAVVGVLAGCLLGFVGFQRLSPETGYTILLLPFLVGGLVLLPTAVWLQQPVAVFVPLMFAVGCCCGGILCGCNAVVGEAFADRSARRTQVLFSSYLLAAALLPVISWLQQLTRSQAGAALVTAVVFLGGLLAVRAIPNPLLSARAQD